MRKNKLVSLLKEKKGNSMVSSVFLVIAILLLLTVIIEFIRIEIIARGVRNALQESVISVATENYEDLYNGIREGYSGGYFLDEEWEESFTSGDIMSYLQDLIGLKKNGADYEKYSGEVMEFRLSNLKIEIKNAPFAPDNPAHEDKFEAIALIGVEIPFSGTWSVIPSIKVTIKVIAGFIPKF